MFSCMTFYRILFDSGKNELLFKIPVLNQGHIVYVQALETTFYNITQYWTTSYSFSKQNYFFFYLFV